MHCEMVSKYSAHAFEFEMNAHELELIENHEHKTFLLVLTADNFITGDVILRHGTVGTDVCV